MVAPLQRFDRHVRAGAGGRAEGVVPQSAPHSQTHRIIAAILVTLVASYAFVSLGHPSPLSLQHEGKHLHISFEFVPLFKAIGWRQMLLLLPLGQKRVGVLLERWFLWFRGLHGGAPRLSNFTNGLDAGSHCIISSHVYGCLDDSVILNPRTGLFGSFGGNNNDCGDNPFNSDCKILSHLLCSVPDKETMPHFERKEKPFIQD